MRNDLQPLGARWVLPEESFATGYLVQVVDVLRDVRLEQAASLPRGKHFVRPVRFCAAEVVVDAQAWIQKGGQNEPKVGWLMAQEVALRLYETLEALAGNSFGSLRQRVARHLK
jgi:hypothetical protein